MMLSISLISFLQLRYVTVYSGTTLENYKTCALTDPKNRIIFDKSREPRHSHRKFYFDENFYSAAIYAADCARGRFPEYTPLVMEGKLSEEVAECGVLFDGKSFPVKHLWVPKDGFDWRKANYFMLDDVQQHFQELDPLVSLKALSPEIH